MAISRAQQKALREIVGRSIPKAYLDLLRSFPRDLSQEFAAAARRPDERALFDDIAVVIRENQMVREEDIWTEDGPWPCDHLVIGADPCGDKMSLGLKDLRVYRLLHEVAEFHEQAPTLDEWVDAVRRYLAGDSDAISKTQKRERAPVPPKSRTDHVAELEELDRALRDSPERGATWQDRARVLETILEAEQEPTRRRALEEDLAETLKRALAHAQDDWARRHALEPLATTLIGLGRSEEALEHLSAHEAQVPTAVLFRARAYEAAGDLEQAWQAIRRFMSEKDPDDLDGYSDDVRIAKSRGEADYRAAVERYRAHLDRKIAKYPDDEWYLEERASLEL